MNARTSQSHPLQIDTLGPVGQGQLGLTFCPGKYDPHAQTGAWSWDLDTDLRSLTEWGASTVVTLMEAHELDLLRVPDLGDRVSGMGLHWWFFADRGCGGAGCALRTRLESGRRGFAPTAGRG